MREHESERHRRRERENDGNEATISYEGPEVKHRLVFTQEMATSGFSTFLFVEDLEEGSLVMRTEALRAEPTQGADMMSKVVYLHSCSCSCSSASSSAASAPSICVYVFIYGGKLCQ